MLLQEDPNVREYGPKYFLSPRCETYVVVKNETHSPSMKLSDTVKGEVRLNY